VAEGDDQVNDIDRYWHDKILDLRNKYDELFKAYKGDVVVEEFRGEIDNLMKKEIK